MKKDCCEKLKKYIKHIDEYIYLINKYLVDNVKHYNNQLLIILKSNPLNTFSIIIQAQIEASLKLAKYIMKYFKCEKKERNACVNTMRLLSDKKEFLNAIVTLIANLTTVNNNLTNAIPDSDAILITAEQTAINNNNIIITSTQNLLRNEIINANQLRLICKCECKEKCGLNKYCEIIRFLFDYIDCFVPAQ